MRFLARRRWRFLTQCGAALYAFFLLTASYEHHDIACHFKTPLHCTACASSLVGSDPQPPAVIGAWHLADAGCACGVQLLSDGALLAASLTGRSPPASF